MLNRHPLGLLPPHQRTFVAFDGQPIAHHLGFALLSRFVGQCGGIVGFAGYLAVRRGDQRITMQPTTCANVSVVSWKAIAPFSTL
jgi:hypothetical protein